MMPRRAPGPPFWVPGGSWTSLLGFFGPMWPHSAPRVDFWRISELIWGVILSPKSMKFGVEFRCVFGMIFGGVLEWFWCYFYDFLGALKILESERGIFQKCLFYIRNSTVFNDCGLHFGFQKW